MTHLVATKSMTISHSNLLTCLATKRVEAHTRVLVTNLLRPHKYHTLSHVHA